MNATNGTGGVGMYSPPPTGANDTNATDMADGYIVSASSTIRTHHHHTSSDADPDDPPPAVVLAQHDDAPRQLDRAPTPGPARGLANPEAVAPSQGTLPAMCVAAHLAHSPSQ